MHSFELQNTQFYTRFVCYEPGCKPLTAKRSFYYWEACFFRPARVKNATAGFFRHALSGAPLPAPADRHSRPVCGQGPSSSGAEEGPEAAPSPWRRTAGPPCGPGTPSRRRRGWWASRWWTPRWRAAGGPPRASGRRRGRYCHCRCPCHRPAAPQPPAPPCPWRPAPIRNGGPPRDVTAGRWP